MLNIRYMPALFLLIFWPPFEVSAFSVSPLRVYMNANEGISVIRVGNPSNKPVTFRLEAFTWADSKAFNELQPTTDLLAVPPVFEVDAGESQVIRIAMRDSVEFPDGVAERTYRLVLNQVPTAVGKREGVSFAYRINMPLFVASPSAKPQAIWSVNKDDSDRPLLTLANEGNAHIQVDNLQLTDGETEAKIFNLKSGGYIFAGERRSWPLDVSLSDLKSDLNLQADTNRGALKALVRLPDG